MLTHYPLKKLTDLSHEFITDQGVLYKIYFLDYSYMFYEYPEISQYVFTFNIDVVEPTSKKTSVDSKIAATIVEVFKHFFLNKNNVVVYVCDNTDDKHYVRKRKFDSWFWRFNNGTIIKEDRTAIIEGTEIVNSLLIHRNNKRLAEIILAFNDLNQRAADK